MATASQVEVGEGTKSKASILRDGCIASGRGLGRSRALRAEAFKPRTVRGECLTAVRTG
jgi:hypothetical protein